MKKINYENEIMNVLITLPKQLIDSIISGEKIYEMRKGLPKFIKIGEDGFFAVEKGTSKVRCWCRIDSVYGTFIDTKNAAWYAERLCVNEDYVRKYANGKQVCFWKIGKVIEISDLDRNNLIDGKNPQQFAYCRRSFGESVIITYKVLD